MTAKTDATFTVSDGATLLDCFESLLSTQVRALVLLVRLCAHNDDEAWDNFDRVLDFLRTELREELARSKHPLLFTTAVDTQLGNILTQCRQQLEEEASRG